MLDNQKNHRSIFLITVVILLVLTGILFAITQNLLFDTRSIEAPTWEAGDWWSYKVEDENGRFLFLGQAEQEWMYAYDRRSTVIGQINVRDEAYYIVSNLYQTDKGPMITIDYLHKETLSHYQNLESYFLDSIEEHNLRPQQFSFPLTERKTWAVSSDYYAVVLGQENVKVPAGSISTYRIEYVQEDEQFAVWYSPKVKNIVRTNGPEVKWELTDWGHDSIDKTFDQLMIDLHEMAQWDPAMAIIQADTLIQYGIESERILEFKELLKKELELNTQQGYPNSG